MNSTQSILLSAFAIPAFPTLSAQDLFWNAGVVEGQRNGNWTATPAWNEAENGNSANNLLWDFLNTTDATAVILQTPEGGVINLDEQVDLGRITAGDGGLYEIAGTNGALRREAGIFVIEVGASGSGELIVVADLSTPDLVKTGNGRLIFRGTTGADVTLDQGELLFSGNNLVNTAILDTQSGTRAVLEGDLTIDRLIANGTIAGPGKLTATRYQLLDGARVEGNLGSGLLALGDGLVDVTGSLGSAVVNVPGGILRLSGGNLAEMAQLSTSGDGMIELLGNQTVGTYLQTGNGSLTGTGTLTSSLRSILRGGDLVGSLVGEIEVRGDTLLSGTAAGPILSVQEGTLSVIGSLLSSQVDILNGATLLSSGQFALDSGFANQGTLQIDSDASVARYLQAAEGRLGGSGILTVSGESVLAGGVIEGSLNGPTRVTGDLEVSGTLGGSRLAIEAGETTVAGTLASGGVEVMPDGSLILAGSFDEVSNLENQGKVVIETNGEIGSYVQGETGKLEGDARLTTTTAALAGGTVRGQLAGEITVTGDLEVPGTLSGETLTITGGTTQATGRLESRSIQLRDATLEAANGNLSMDSVLEANGTSTLRLNRAETIAGLVSSGVLEGPGSLTANTLALQDGARVSLPVQGRVTSTGSVLLQGGGAVSGERLEVSNGTFTAGGRLASSEIKVGPNAELHDVAEGVFSAGSTLLNEGRVTFSGDESLGSLRNRGELAFSVLSANERDFLTLGAGGLTLDPGSILVIDELGLSFGQNVRIIDGEIRGVFDDILTPDGDLSALRFTFDASQGTLQTLPGIAVTRNSANRLYNLSRNQTQIFGNAFDQVYNDPIDGGGNFRQLFFRRADDGTGRFLQVADEDRRAGDLTVLDLDPGRGREAASDDGQDALLSDFVSVVQTTLQPATNPDGSPSLDLNGNPIPEVAEAGLGILNGASPESYLSLGQITGEVLRAQMRQLGGHQPVFESDLFAITTDLQFANGGVSGFSSDRNPDWDFTSFTAALHHKLTDAASLGLLIGINDGSLNQSTGDFDFDGSSVGLFGSYQFRDRGRTRAFASLGFTTQEFSGRRRSFGGDARVDDLDSVATEISLGVRSTIWDRNQIKIHPHASLRYLRTEVDSFSEEGPGLALAVDDFSSDSFLLEAGLDAAMQLNEVSTFHAGLGLIHDFASDDQRLKTRFVTGNPFSIRSSTNDLSAFVLHTGMSFELRENLSLFFNARGEFRDSAPNVQVFSLSGSFTF